MFGIVRRHATEYLIEAALLALFMVSACGFAMLLSYPASPLVAYIHYGALRRLLMGLAMGSTAVALVYSPWGKQSGGHLNPAITLTFFRLGKVAWNDALFYTMSQAVGGLCGVTLMAALFGRWLSHASVNYVVTVPGSNGSLAAWSTEFAMSFALMTLVLVVSNTPRFARFTGLFAGALVAINISLLAPLSGMSMNPARTLASAVPSGVWTSVWVYFTAPPLAMLSAAQVYLWVKGRGAVFCAKLHHQNSTRCIFCETRARREAAPKKRFPVTPLTASHQTMRQVGQHLTRTIRTEHTS